MKEIANSGVEFLHARETRIMRTMAVAVLLAVLISLPFAPWRIITGLILGGLLGLANYHWMRLSVAAVFDGAIIDGKKPTIRLASYVLRYFVIAGVVLVAYHLDIVSLAATITGLCSFVVAFFFEAFREVYLAIIHREEN